jgi:hypothetical protein
VWRKGGEKHWRRRRESDRGKEIEARDRRKTHLRKGRPEERKRGNINDTEGETGETAGNRHRR